MPGPEIYSYIYQAGALGEKWSFTVERNATTNAVVVKDIRPPRPIFAGVLPDYLVAAMGTAIDEVLAAVAPEPEFE